MFLCTKQVFFESKVLFKAVIINNLEHQTGNFCHYGE